MALNITQAEANLLHPSPAQKTTISATSSLLTRTDPKELEEISGESNLAEVEAPLKSEKYFLSQNPDETERLRLQHELIKDHLGGSLILAPIDFSKKDLSVLDSATADGHFLRSLSLSIPSSTQCTYTGTDINPNYFPPHTSPEITFLAHNITQRYPAAFPNRPFDLIHQRLALPGCGAASMKTAVERLVGMLKPGGWIQLVEADHETDPSAGVQPVIAAPSSQDRSWRMETNGTAVQEHGNKERRAEMTPGAMRDVYAVVRGLFSQAGIQTGYAKAMAGWLSEMGLEEVQERICDLQLGAKNPKEDIGKIGARSFGLATKGIVAVASKMGNTILSLPELEALPERVEQELLSVGGVHRLHAVWGKKPV